MKALIDRFSSLVKGVLSGFDRIVFKGWIIPLMSASQVTSFLGSKGVLNKDYKNWMVARTKEIVSTTEQYARDNCGQPIRNEDSITTESSDNGLTSCLLRVSFSL